ncbi:MAG TPA: efflux RND transporter periplasmic adaptor subunit [Bryobacteraceae bacterium]|nr:efflux RND transporter periplasmic adaptor subunit [Bryobacteraceae bacterium]
MRSILNLLPHAVRFRPESRRQVAALAVLAFAACLSACSGSAAANVGGNPGEGTMTAVAVTRVARKPIVRQITISSELVPFQEIDVYAKESGYVKQLLVDYGTRVREGQLMAVLEIPELEMQLRQDEAAIQSATDQVTHASHEVNRLEAQHRVAQLQYDRLNGVATTRPGLVAQQEVDDAQGKDLALEAQVEATKSALATAQSQLDVAKASLERDQVLFAYARITAPFAGVVTQRYANLGTLMQAGTSSSTQALPLVRLSQDDKFRLVIPVPESYVRYIRVGDPVQVRVPSLDKTVPGAVARFSVDVAQDTRTMHTEVDVVNPAHVLMPGLYAEATLTLERSNSALTVPVQAVNRTGASATALIVDANNMIEERPVALGIESAGDIEILRGLQEGDRVVVSDRAGLKPGSRVKPQAAESQADQAGNSQ